jgi:hypothetical protein
VIVAKLIYASNVSLDGCTAEFELLGERRCNNGVVHLRYRPR